MSTDTQGMFADYYAGVSSHEWFNSLTPNQVEAIRSIRMTAEGYGVCENCSRPSALYNITTTMRNWSYLCFNCTRKALRYDDNIGQAWNTARVFTDTDTHANMMLFPVEWYPTHEGTRDTCLCDRMILRETDYRSHSIYLSGTVAVTHDGETRMVHKSCTFHCSECDTNYFGNQHTYFDGYATCLQCSEDKWDTQSYHQCENCSEWFSELMYAETRSLELCNTCYYEDFECGSCGEYRHEDDEHVCFRDRSGLFSYSHKPDPVFYGTDNYYFGLELEVEDVSETGIYKGVEVVEQELGDRVYCKGDGSLQDGFEIVTHPHSFDQLENLNWEWLSRLRRLGFRSWDTSTCGIHIHISRTAFWKNGKRDEGHELRFQKLIYDNSHMVEAISGRSSSYAQFRDKGYLVPKVKLGISADRYEAVNTENYATLEVRVFRGSLKKQRVLSAIEFVHAATEYTRNMKINPKDKQLSWFRFMAYVLDNQDKYSNFTQIALKVLETTSVGQRSTEEDN